MIQRYKTDPSLLECILRSNAGKVAVLFIGFFILAALAEFLNVVIYLATDVVRALGWRDWALVATVVVLILVIRQSPKGEDDV